MNKREISGLVLAPLASGFLQGGLMGNFGSFVFGAVLSYIFAVLIGLPAFMFARRKGWISLSQIASIGFLAGLVVAGLVMVLSGTEGFGLMSILGSVSLLGMHGLLVSLIFWFIAYSNFTPA